MHILGNRRPAINKHSFEFVAALSIVLILNSGCEPEEVQADPVSIIGNWQATDINADFTISVLEDMGLAAAIEAQLLAYGVPQEVLDQAAPLLQAAITDLLEAESWTLTTEDLAGGDVAFSVRFSDDDSCAIHFKFTVPLRDGPVILDYSFIGSWTLTDATLALAITTDDMALEGVVVLESDLAPTQILLTGDTESQLAIDMNIPIVFPPSPTEYMIYLEDIPVSRHTVVEVTLTMTGT